MTPPPKTGGGAQFWTGMRYVFTDFSLWTSTHGVPHIGMSNTKLLTIFWSLITLASFCLFIWQFVSLFNNYIKYSVNTQTTLQYSEMTFPSVTICHLNPWKLKDILERSTEMSSLITAYNSHQASASFGFTDGLTADRQALAEQWTLLYSERLKRVQDETNDLAYTYRDMIVSCTYNADNCNSTDFVDFYNPTYGICQQFNTNGGYTSTRAGALYGLQLVMKTDTATYLPWTEIAGVIMVISAQGETPYPDVFGYFAPPGTASSIGMNYVSTTRLSKPYGSCTTRTHLSTEQFEGAYSVEACIRSCTQEKIIEVCGCYDPSYAHSENSTAYVSCDGYGDSLTNLQCIEQINSPENTEFNVINDCTCPQPCQIDSYGITVSTALWPATGYTPTECQGDPNTTDPWYQSGTTCLEWYQKNTLLLEIYYEAMNFQVLTESPAYTFVSFISDVGGQVGLFLGMSIISLIEFFSLTILLCCYCMTHKKRKMEMEQLDEEIRRTKAQYKKNKGVYNNTGDPVPPAPVKVD